MPDLIERLRNPFSGTAIEAARDMRQAIDALEALKNVAWQYSADMRFPNLTAEQRERRLAFITEALSKLDGKEAK